jgi:hypothetical protein
MRQPQVPPNEGSLANGVQEQALPLRPESAQDRQMGFLKWVRAHVLITLGFVLAGLIAVYDSVSRVQQLWTLGLPGWAWGVIAALIFGLCVIALLYEHDRRIRTIQAPASGPRAPGELPMLPEHVIKQRETLERIEGRLEALTALAQKNSGDVAALDRMQTVTHELLQHEKTERQASVGALGRDLGEATVTLQKEMAAMTKAVTALARIRLFEHYRAEVTRWDEEAKAAWQGMCKVLFDEREYDAEGWQKDYAAARSHWEQTAKEIQMLWEDAFGEAIEVLTHKNYDQNQHRPVPMDDLIEDLAKRQEFRRATDERASYENAVSDLHMKIEARINEATNIAFSRAVGRDL